MPSLKSRLSDLAHCLGVPLLTLCSPRFGFAVFFRRDGEWRLRTRGRSVPVRAPRLWALEYFRRHMPGPGDLVLDVGGEQGLETRQFAELVGPGGRVLVFECFPEHVARLSEIAARLQQVTVVPVACWNEETELSFFTGHTPGSNTAVADARGQSGQALADAEAPGLKVRACPLDTIWSEMLGGQPVDFLKMDIEGAELEALDGARALLAHTRHAVIAAYHLRDGEPTAGRVETLLRAAGMHTRVDANLHVYAWR